MTYTDFTITGCGLAGSGSRKCRLKSKNYRDVAAKTTTAHQVASAPSEVLYEKFGLTADAVVSKALELL